MLCFVRSCIWDLVAHTLEDLPLFTADASASFGLDMLASATLESSKLYPLTADPKAITGLGHFTPVASLPIKLVKKILELEFVDMVEITADDDSPPVGGRM